MEFLIEQRYRIDLVDGILKIKNQEYELKGVMFETSIYQVLITETELNQLEEINKIDTMTSLRW